MAQNKYGAKKTICKNITFDSKAESLMYMYLSHKYKHIELQPKFLLQPKFTDNTGATIRAINYIADFKIDNIVIDVKGVQTKDFIIKAKMFKYKYPELKLLIGSNSELIKLI